MINNNFYIIKTILSIPVKVKTQIRFYPRGYINNTRVIMPPIRNVLTRIPRNFYDNRCMTRRVNYPSSLHNGNFIYRIFGLGYLKRSAETHSLKNIPQSSWNVEVEEHLQGTISSTYSQIDNNSTSMKQNENDYNQEIGQTILYIKDKLLNNDKISNVFFNKLLIQLNQIESLTDSEKEIVLLLKVYFQRYHPMIDDAELFIEIWNRHNFEFKAIGFVPEKNLEVVESNNDVLVREVQDKKSYQEKKQECLNNISDISKKMNALFLKHKDDPKKILSDKALQEWSNFLENRGSVIPMQPEEIAINENLKALYKKHVPKQEELLNKVKDNMKILKENSTLAEYLKQDSLEQCFVLEDYIKEITRINDSLLILKSTDSLSLNNLKLLSINSFAATIDAEGSFKLTQEAYKSFAANKKFLQFCYTKDNPQIDYVLNKIKERKFVVLDEAINIPGSIIDMAHLSHKTLVIRDDNSGKNILVRIGLLTSADDENTIFLDKYQQTNPDSVKQNKKQFYRVFSNFILVDETEPLIVDLETTLLLQSVNTDNESIIKKLVDSYQSTKDTWSNNNYQVPYKGDEEFLRRIAIIFYELRLKYLKENLQKLKDELNLLNREMFDEKINDLYVLKQKNIEDKKFQQYFSLLPENFKQLYKVLKAFDVKLQKDKKKQQEKARKQENVAAMMKSNSELNKEKDKPTGKTAKEKREDYLKAKQSEQQHNTNEQNI